MIYLFGRYKKNNGSFPMIYWVESIGYCFHKDSPTADSFLKDVVRLTYYDLASIMENFSMRCLFRSTMKAYLVHPKK